MPNDGFARKVNEVVRRDASGDGIVVIPGKDNAAEPTHEGQGLAWLGSVADDVSKAGDAVDAFPCDVLECALKGLDIGVQVGDDGILHWANYTIIDETGRVRLWYNSEIE